MGTGGWGGREREGEEEGGTRAAEDEAGTRRVARPETAKSPAYDSVIDN